MPKTARTKRLESGLRRCLQPTLARHGFHYVAKTRSFYRTVGECIQIIAIQPGVRSAEGTFTVNLAVYHPRYRDPYATESDWPREYDCLMAFRTRLATLRESWRTRLCKRLFGQRDSWLAWWLTGMPDHWWPYSSQAEQVEHSLAAVSRLLEQYGLRWLADRTDIEALRASHETIIRRTGPS